MKKEVSVLQVGIESDIPVLIWGPPGTGKTATVEALAREAGAHLETLIGSTLDPTDLSRPVLGDDGEIHLSAAPSFRRVRKALDEGKPVWLFLDEFSCVPPSVQAALLRAVQERAVGDVSLRGCRFLAAANPTDQAAGGWDLAAATANRWLHLDWSVDFEEWAAGEIAGWGHARSDSHVQASSLLVNFIRHRPSALLDCPKDPVQASRGWPSPRAWSNVGRALAQVRGSVVESETARLCVLGLVGEATAREFLVWAVDQDLPAPLDLLDGRAALPERGDRQRAAVEGAIAYALNRNVSGDMVMRLIGKARKDVRVSLGRTYFRAAEVAKVEPSFGPEFSEIVAEIRGVHAVRAKATVRFER